MENPELVNIEPVFSYHFQRIQELIREAISTTNQDKFGDLCQKIVFHDQNIQSNDLVSTLTVKGTHGHDLASNTQSFEVKGIPNLFDFNKQHRIRIRRKYGFDSRVLVIVAISKDFEICHLLYIPMTHIKNWFKDNPSKKNLYWTFSAFIPLAEKRRTYHFVF